MKKIVIAALIIFGLGACNDDNDEDNPKKQYEFTYDFNDGAEGWIGEFADYPVGEQDSYELEFEQTSLPQPLDESQGALMLSGKNMSDDLFMFAKRKVTGLEPNEFYNATFRIEFASNVADGMAGVGGSPGESVFIKAGATDVEPQRTEDDMDYYRMTIDKGNQSQGGEDMLVIGDFSNDTGENEYTLKTLTNSSFIAMTNDNGELWLIVGTDSGFEATTRIYYNRISVTLN